MATRDAVPTGARIIAFPIVRRMIEEQAGIKLSQEEFWDELAPEVAAMDDSTPVQQFSNQFFADLVVRRITERG
ncbi:hypothetical protein ACFL09_04040 [Planctomycetota bacterium]